VKNIWKGLLLWSNHFYGICAALLAVESGITLLHKIPSISILVFIYIATVIYYSQTYLQEAKGSVYNERTSWYQKNTNYLIIRQCILLLILVYVGLFKLYLGSLFFQASILVKGIFITTLAIALYYDMPSLFNQASFSFRKIGFLKSMSIAWVWTISCFLFPIWHATKLDFPLLFSNSFFWFYFLQLFVYIFILAMLFDVKDVNQDQADQVKTIVIKFGVTSTLNKLLIPLLCVYVAISAYMTYVRDLNLAYFYLQTLLAFTTYFIAKRVVHHKSIATHILLIDGLMIVKVILSFILI
jgi:4-hydroxybenzoate polyprenyltransferase